MRWRRKAAQALARGYAGMRVSRSTLLRSRAGKLLGLSSTHFQSQQCPSERELQLIDLYTRTSVAHEINQPLGAIVNNSNVCVRLFDKDGSKDEIREALSDIVMDALRASSVIARTRELVRKTPPKMALLALNETFDEVLALANHRAGSSPSRRRSHSNSASVGQPDYQRYRRHE